MASIWQSHAYAYISPGSSFTRSGKKRPVWEDIKQVVALYGEINPKGN